MRFVFVTHCNVMKCLSTAHEIRVWLTCTTRISSSAEVNLCTHTRTSTGTMTIGGPFHIRLVTLCSKTEGSMLFNVDIDDIWQFQAQHNKVLSCNVIDNEKLTRVQSRRGQLFFKSKLVMTAYFATIKLKKKRLKKNSSVWLNTKIWQILYALSLTVLWCDAKNDLIVSQITTPKLEILPRN